MVLDIKKNYNSSECLTQVTCVYIHICTNNNNQM